MHSGPGPTGYRIVRAQSAGRWACVYSAVRERDARDVVLKTYQNDPSGGDSRARREQQAFASMAGVGIPRCLELIEAPPTRTLVLERAPGEQLAVWARETCPGPCEVVRVALQLSQILGRIHEARMLHCDLTPANIMVDPESLDVHVIDLGLARPLGSVIQPTEVRSSVNAVALGLHFIAPEQTGRMGRGIDCRSDLYTLGATLYYALTGATLFESNDALALIHAHMARVPISPHERRSDIPVALSRIVMKLLKKEPEERYQTARALEQDLLTCLDQLERRGWIEPELALGTADLCSKPVFHQRLYGRAAELRELRDALRRTASAGPLRVMLTGAPGAGKSSLVRALRVDVTRMRGHLVVGKFDRYRSARPYAGFRQAIEDLAQQLLVASDEELRSWRERLRASLGTLATVLSDLVPDFAHVLGKTDPAPPLGPRETRMRLVVTIERLLACAAARDQPLVLFLDDWQWADDGSRWILRALMQACECPGLLVITAHRDEEEDAAAGELQQDDDVGRVDVRIELGPLRADACAEMLGDALASENRDEMHALAEWVVRKSGGSPLLAQEFVLHLFEAGRIHLKDERWEWDLEQIRGTEAPEGAVDLLVAKLRRLESDAREMIEIASLAADAFDAQQLVELTGRPRQAVEPHLFGLADQGLIVPDAAGFRFAHDRIREAAQALLAPEAHADLHERMAWMLAERTPETELPRRALEIADHLLCSNPGALTEDQRPRTIAIYRVAGTQSLAAGAGTTACLYLRAARKLVRTEDWATEPAPMFELLLQSAAAEFQAEQHREALELLAELEPHARTPLEQTRIEAQRILVHAVIPGSDAVGLTLEIAARFGLRLPRQPARWRATLELWRTDIALRGPLDERTFPAPQGGAAGRILPLLLVMGAGAPIMLAERGSLALLTIGFIIRALRRHGTFRNPGRLLAAYASFRAMHRRDLEGMHRYAKAARSWLESDSGGVVDVRAHFVLQAFLLPWLGPRRDVLEPIRGLVERAKELGDVETWKFLSLYLADYAAFAGEPLESSLRDIDGLRGVVVRGGANVRLDRIYSAAYHLLRTPAQEIEEARGRLDRVGALFEELHRTGAAYWVVRVHWLHVLVLLGRFDCAFEWSEELFPAMQEVGTPGVTISDYLLLRGLSAAAIGQRHPSRSRRARVARACLRQLRVWARHSPDCRPMCILLEAELMHLRQRPTSALARYQEAASAATRGGFVQYAALAHERRAALLHELQRDWDAKGALRLALESYDRWGAQAKVQEISEYLDGTPLGASPEESGGTSAESAPTRC